METDVGTMEGDDMDERDADELRQLAAQMYGMLVDCEDIGEYTEPSDDDDACPGDCSDCGWYRSDLRDSLLRLGVPI